MKVTQTFVYVDCVLTECLYKCANVHVYTCTLICGTQVTPLQPEILSMGSDMNGTSKLLTYLLDNLTGELSWRLAMPLFAVVFLCTCSSARVGWVFKSCLRFLCFLFHTYTCTCTNVCVVPVSKVFVFHTCTKCVREKCARVSCTFTLHLRFRLLSICASFSPHLRLICRLVCSVFAFTYPRNIRPCAWVQCGQCSTQCGPTSDTKVLEDSESRLNVGFAVQRKMYSRQTY